MDDMAVIVRGKDSPLSCAALYSTVHGAGRIMSRRQAKKSINFRAVQDLLRAHGTVLRGAAAGEGARRLPQTRRRPRAARRHHGCRAHPDPAHRRHGRS